MDIAKPLFFKNIYIAFHKKPLWKSMLLLFLLLRVFIPLLPILLALPILLFHSLPQDISLYNYPQDDLLWKDIVLGGFLSPVIETAFLQCLPIWLFHETWKRSYFISILLSGLIFGLLHTYSLVYIFSSIMGGIVLAFGFVLYSKKYSTGKAFIIIYCIHAISNITAFLGSFLF